MVLAPAALGRFWKGVEVELSVDRDVVLHVVVPLPVTHHRCLQVIPDKDHKSTSKAKQNVILLASPDMAMVALIGGWSPMRKI